MPKREEWLRPLEAARLIARTLRVSLGAARPILREAMASREVRVCSIADGEREYLPAELWDNAEFDFDRNIVIGADQWALKMGLLGQRQYEALEISADDLRHWLRQNRDWLINEYGIAAPTSPKSASTTTGTGGRAAAPKPQAVYVAPKDAKRAAGSKQTMEAAAREYIAATYPNGLPAGKTNKMIAAEYTSSTSAPMSERTVRRARNGKG